MHIVFQGGGGGGGTGVLDIWYLIFLGGGGGSDIWYLIFFRGSDIWYLIFFRGSDIWYLIAFHPPPPFYTSMDEEFQYSRDTVMWLYKLVSVSLSFCPHIAINSPSITPIPRRNYHYHVTRYQRAACINHRQGNKTTRYVVRPGSVV